MAMTKTEQALKAKAEMQNLFQAAIDEQLAIIKDAEQKLGELGFTEEKPVKKSITRQRDPNKPCGICGFVTEPTHDGRAHKHKQKTPKAFTDKELADNGYKKR